MHGLFSPITLLALGKYGAIFLQKSEVNKLIYCAKSHISNFVCETGVTKTRILECITGKHPGQSLHQLEVIKGYKDEVCSL